MFFGFDSRPAQKASVTVIESPKCANVPGVPVNRACTCRIGSIQSSVAPFFFAAESDNGNARKIATKGANGFIAVERMDDVRDYSIGGRSVEESLVQLRSLDLRLQDEVRELRRAILGRADASRVQAGRSSSCKSRLRSPC